MPREYDEKRDAVRVDVDCPILYRPEDNGGQGQKPEWPWHDVYRPT